MNYKSLTIIALALCLCIAVPVSAMWNNGNWVSDDKNNNCDNVKFDPKTGVTSCYRDNNPVNEIKASENGNGGIAVGSVRAGYSTLSDTITVRNVLQADNVSPMIVIVNPDATFRIPEPDKGVLAPGNYSATLDNFNLPDETVYFTIAANQQEPTRISFNGQAVSAPAAERTLEIVKAQYGEIQSSCVERTLTSHYMKFGYHLEYHYRYGESHHGHCDSESEWSEWTDVFNQQRSSSRTCIQMETRWAKHVTECTTAGAVIDVTGIVQGLVSNGHLTIIADYPNQHYNALFTDPAPGIFKHLSVDYKINGGVLMHKTVAEDEDLNI